MGSDILNKYKKQNNCRSVDNESDNGNKKLNKEIINNKNKNRENC
jgi:hypothetical protein